MNMNVRYGPASAPAPSLKYDFPVPDVHPADENDAVVAGGFGPAVVDAVHLPSVMRDSDAAVPDSGYCPSAVRVLFKDRVPGRLGVRAERRGGSRVPDGIVGSSEKVCGIHHVVQAVLLYGEGPFCPPSVDLPGSYGTAFPLGLAVIHVHRRPKEQYRLPDDP